MKLNIVDNYCQTITFCCSTMSELVLSQTIRASKSEFTQDISFTQCIEQMNKEININYCSGCGAKIEGVNHET